MTRKLFCVLLALMLAVLALPAVAATVSEDPINYLTVSTKVGKNNLSVTMKGLTKESGVKVLSQINDIIDQLLVDNQVQVIEYPDLLDAEKYGSNAAYDSNLCNFATAANMLWSSGYAQDAINPRTNSFFKNTDEVFDYFRHNFTNYGGRPLGGINWFLYGNYTDQYDVDRYGQEAGWSALKKIHDEGGLLPSAKNVYTMNGGRYVPEVLDNLTLNNKIGAIRVRKYYFDTESNKYLFETQHWVTVVGIITDEKATNPKEKYKAIIIADSDNDMVCPSNNPPTVNSDEQRAALAAKAPNTYTVYGLSYIETDKYTFFDYIDDEKPLYGGDFWALNNYDGDKKGVITWVFTINERTEKESSIITWLDENGNEIDKTIVENGTMPTHEEPKKQASTEKTYSFAGWSPTPVAVTGPVTYQATYSETVNSYTITWKNDDGTVIDTTSVEYGKMPTHADPVKAETADYKYEFAGWQPQVVAVTGNAEYTATYNQIVKYFTFSGEGQNHEKGSGTEKEFIVKCHVDDDKAFSLFTGIQVDGVAVDKNNYNAVQGSVKITLKASYLDTLSVGDHILTVLFTDGKDDIPFTVSAAVKPIDPTNFNDIAVPSDSFTFKKVWQGDVEKSIDFTLYKADGSVYHHGFDKKVVSKTEWRYNAYFSAPVACYVIEQPVPGYITKYVNVGVYENITDRCCNGGTIINKKIPKTGDTADFALWAGMALVGVIGLTTTVILLKRRKAQK